MTTATTPPATPPLARSAQYNFLAERKTALEVARTQGCFLITTDGRRILDAAGGAIVVGIGHGRHEVGEAYAAACAQTDFVVPPFATESRIRLVERLRRWWLPTGLNRIYFASGGSEAMDAAIRLARQHHLSAGRPERWRVIGRELSYHGTTLATLAVGGHTKRRAGFEPWLLDVRTDQPRPPAHYCLRCPLGLTYPGCQVACVEEFGRVLERVGHETAAVVIEPIVGSNAGALVPPDEYLPRLRALCDAHGVLLIADEVMTGFGRTGTKFGVDHWRVIPDIIVGGKGLTSGYAPLYAVCAHDRVLEPIAAAGDELMFYTYGAHSACCAAADVVLDILEREGLVDRAATMGRVLEAKLRAALGGHPHVGDIRGRGLLWGIELVRDRATLEPFAKETRLIDKVVAAGIEHGAFFYPGGNDPARHVVCLGPPFIITETELDLLVGILQRAIDAAVARVH